MDIGRRLNGGATAFLMRVWEKEDCGSLEQVVHEMGIWNWLFGMLDAMI
jgi:hypothetical protein